MTEAINNNSDYYYSPDNTSNQTQSLADPEAFLKILIAQLKYQNPLEPQDSSTFVAQLTQMATMEQMYNVSTSMDNLATKYEMARYFELIGQQVFLINGDEVLAGVVGGVILDDGEPSFYLQGDENGVHYTLEQLLSVTGDANYDIINYSSLVGQNVVVQDGSSEVSGTVEKVIIQNGEVAVWVNGAAYGIDLITEVHGMSGEEETDSESTE